VQHVPTCSARCGPVWQHRRTTACGKQCLVYCCGHQLHAGKKQCLVWCCRHQLHAGKKQCQVCCCRHQLHRGVLTAMSTYTSNSAATHHCTKATRPCASQQRTMCGWGRDGPLQCARAPEQGGHQCGNDAWGPCRQLPQAAVVLLGYSRAHIQYGWSWVHLARGSNGLRVVGEGGQAVGCDGVVSSLSKGVAVAGG
jgi:hypothetical protein